MKPNLALIALFSSASAFAFPTVGDQAIYNMSLQGGETATLTLSIASVDSTTGQVSLDETIAVAGQVVSTEDNQPSTVPLNINYSDAGVCASTAAGAQIETVTVPQGTYQACHFSTTANGTQSDLWLASIPFSIVKQVTASPNGTSSTMELIQLNVK